MIENWFLGLADGKLVRWTKGFNCEGVEGRNVVELLQEALARRGDVQIEICAILNDTTGTCHDRHDISYDWCYRKKSYRVTLVIKQS